MERLDEDGKVGWGWRGWMGIERLDGDREVRWGWRG